MILTTRRLELRPVRADDASLYFALNRRPEVAVPGGFLPWTLPLARKRLREGAALWKDLDGERAFAIALKAGGTWIGGITLRWPHRGVGELGYGVTPEHWGRGYATEAVIAVLGFAFARRGAHRVQATCWVGNPASAKVLKKAGLREEGVLRGFLKRGQDVRDERMFGITRWDWRARR